MKKVDKDERESRDMTRAIIQDENEVHAFFFWIRKKMDKGNLCIDKVNGLMSQKDNRDDNNNKK